MLKLLRWRVRIIIAQYRGVMVLIAPILALGVFVLAVLGSRGIFSVLVPRAPAFADALLLLAYAAVGGFQVIAGFRWGITRLFLNSDLELLMVAPLPRRRLFGMKLFELVIASPISLALLAAVTWGFGRAHAMAVAPLLALVVPLLLATIAALPGMLVALVLARVMIGPRLRMIIGLITPLLPLAWVIFAGSASSFYARVSSDRFDAARLDAVGRSILHVVGRSPTSWPGNLVRAIAAHDWALLGTDLVLIAIAAGALIAVTYTVFFATFESSWTQLAEASTKKRSGTLLERIAPPVPRVARGIVIKEWRSFVRDMRLLQTLVFPLLIYGFLAIDSLRRTGTPPYAFTFIIPFVISNQAAVGLLMERKNIGLLKLAPVRGIDLIAGKSIAYAVPTALLIAATAAGIGFVRHLALWTVVVSIVVIVWILAGCMVGGVATAALWGRFDLERPRLGIGPVFAEMAELVVFAATQTGLALWIAGRFAHHNPIVGLVLLVFAAASTGMIVLFTTLGARRLETFDAP